MEPHRLAEERSLAYHRVIAERLATEPALLEEARQRVAGWLAGGSPSHFARRWDQILAGDPATIAAILVDPGEEGRELRQSTPFAGALSARERWAIWEAVGRRADAHDA